MLRIEGSLSCTKEYPKIENEIPLIDENITRKWLENILSTSSELETLEVMEVIYIRNDGFFSNSIKSTVRLKSGELEKLYIKIGLQNENSVESFATFYGLDQRELQVYKTILPTMAQFEEIHLGTSHLKSFLPKVSTFYNYTGYILFLLICKLNIDS